MAILKYHLPFAEAELLALTVEFLQQAHALKLDFSPRDGINLLRFAIKRMAQDPKHPLGRDAAWREALVCVLGEEAADLEDLARRKRRAHGRPARPDGPRRPLLRPRRPAPSPTPRTTRSTTTTTTMNLVPIVARSDSAKSGAEHSYASVSIAEVGGRRASSRPGGEHGLVERRVAVDEHRQPDLVEQRHDPGVGLADPQAAAGPVEPEVVGQQDADRLSREVVDEFEVDDDPAGQRLLQQRHAAVDRSASSGLVIVELGQLGRDDQDVLDDLVLDAACRVGLARSTGSSSVG